jgi:hypothetical protein
MGTARLVTAAVGERRARDRLGLLLVIAGASVVAALSARPWAGSWNDASRLAAVESLVDRHTLAIDDCRAGCETSIVIAPSMWWRGP